MNTVDKCISCNEDIFESGSISRCLKCGKATPREVSGKEYLERKENMQSLNNK